MLNELVELIGGAIAFLLIIGFYFGMMIFWFFIIFIYTIITLPFIILNKLIESVKLLFKWYVIMKILEERMSKTYYNYRNYSWKKYKRNFEFDETFLNAILDDYKRLGFSLIKNYILYMCKVCEGNDKVLIVKEMKKRNLDYKIFLNDDIVHTSYYFK